jgi:hypothetical protein
MSDFDQWGGGWEELRALLQPCPQCQATCDQLMFSCAQMCATARVYCGECGYGIGRDGQPMHIVYAEPGHDARPAAVVAWNAVERK